LQLLVSAVVHDLSTSVRHMTTFSRLIVAELGNSLTERQLAYADHLKISADHCSAMLDQLQLYSQIQRRNLDRTLHDPTPAIGRIPPRLNRGLEALDAEISVEPLGAVCADPEMILIATEALLDNALKFRRPGLLARVSVSPAHDNAFWRMRVCDNGIGVDPSYREVAFTIFRRLNAVGDYPGLGVGLAICRRIARRHHGEVRFLDCEDGACVELAIPHAVAVARHKAEAGA
jgi:light-regulated signal transduction histidine kinase (bacteriophytochrome)